MKSQRNILVWLPLLVAVCIGGGIWIGHSVIGPDRTWRWGTGDNKLNNIFHLISQEYVDPVNVDSIVELTIPQVLSKLDPHTV